MIKLLCVSVLRGGYFLTYWAIEFWIICHFHSFPVLSTPTPPPFPAFNDFCSTFCLSECSIFLSFFFFFPLWILTWLHHMLWPTRCQWMWYEQKLEMHLCSLTSSHYSCDLSQKEYASSSCWFKENVETFGVDWNTTLNLELNPGELSWVYWSYSQLTD